MHDTVHITTALPEDAEAILRLQHLAYQKEALKYNDFSIAPLCETLEELHSHFARFTFLKALHGEEIVGSVRAEMREQTCYIGRLMVHPEYRQHGIGSALMRAIEAHYAQATRFELFTGHQSDDNIRLYQRLGYKIYSTVAVTPALSMVYMEKITPIELL